MKQTITYTCKKCGYFWQSRIENPKTCPRCKSYTWNQEYKREQIKEKGEEK